MFKKIFFLTVLFLSVIALSACSISFKTNNVSGSDGGLYKSDNRGDKWAQKVLIPTVTGRPRSIGGLNAVSLAVDPSDNKAIYLGSEDNGLFYTYDGAENWQPASGLGKITVNAVAVDSDSKCVIYAASANKLYKSTDCSRTWSQAYYDNDLKVSVNAIAVGNSGGDNVYIGTSRGEVIKSSDAGESWQTLNRLDDPVKKIIISPQDEKIIFAATAEKGIFRSTDGGFNWLDLSDNMKEFKDGKKFRDIAASKSEAGLVILATYYGLLRSADNGDSWSKIELITPEKDAVINALAISPENEKEIYYVTNTTFYRSLDGGENWATKKLPTARAGWGLLIDPKDPSVIYLGARGIKK